MATRCTACGQTFGGVTPFDKHRVGTFDRVEDGKIIRGSRRCLCADEMRQLGLELLPRGWGQRAYPNGVTVLI